MPTPSRVRQELRDRGLATAGGQREILERLASSLVADNEEDETSPRWSWMYSELRSQHPRTGNTARLVGSSSSIPYVYGGYEPGIPATSSSSRSIAMSPVKAQQSRPRSHTEAARSTQRDRLLGRTERSMQYHSQPHSRPLTTATSPSRRYMSGTQSISRKYGSRTADYDTGAKQWQGSSAVGAGMLSGGGSGCLGTSIRNPLVTNCLQTVDTNPFDLQQTWSHAAPRHIDQQHQHQYQERSRPDSGGWYL